MASWQDTFAALVLAQMEEGEATGAREEVLHLLEPSLCSSGRWSVDYVRVRFGIRRPVARAT